VTSDPWQPPEWHVTVRGPLPVFPQPERAWQWPGDGIAFAVTTVVVTLSGSVAGLVWTALAPKLSVPRVLLGSEAPFRSQIGADAWFLLVAAAAGVLCALVAQAVGGIGPGVMAGLAVGGAAAAVVADRVGYLAHRGTTLAALHAAGVDPAGVNLGVIDFRVRALGVLVAWPLAAVVVQTVAVAVRGSRS
jgi:hypothetical protein